MGYFRERLQGAKRAFVPLEIGTMNQKFLENLKSASWFRFDLILAITLCLPVWHSHCTRASFTILLLCSDTLAQGCATCGPRAKRSTTKWIFMPVTSTRQPVWNEGAARGLICLIAFGPSVIKVAHPCASGSLMSTPSSCYIKCVFPHVTVDLRHLWQEMQRDSDCW